MTAVELQFLERKSPVMKRYFDFGAPAYDEERGYPPYHPTMMVALLLYNRPPTMRTDRARPPA